MTQADKANQFASLHVPGSPLVLYNIWDAGGAKALANAGAPAVATGSWSVAGAQGYPDGESIPLDLLLKVLERIVATVDVPVSLDFEGGYASAPEEVAANVQKVISAGAVGINFEDQIVGGDGLYPVADQAARIDAVRQMADEQGIPFFINARTDIYLKADSTADSADFVEEALERAAAYAEAGASGFFVPGLVDTGVIQRICNETNLPVNVMMAGPLNSVAAVADLGVARASFGPGPYRIAMKQLAEAYQAL
ncbi:MAG: isocitrate lyase/phosphoenolpyruvate mutase family protein [Pseudomonadota bacterium]